MLTSVKSLKHFCVTLALLGLAALAHANPSTIVGSVSVTPLDPVNPWCPGGLVQITAVMDDSSSNGEEGRFHIALADNVSWPGTCWTSIPNSIQGNIWHFACDGCTTGTTGAPLV